MVNTLDPVKLLVFTMMGTRMLDLNKVVDIRSVDFDNYVKIIYEGVRGRNLSVYKKHHIVPRFFYGDCNFEIDSGNTVCLTEYEHFMAHYYLYKCVARRYKIPAYRALRVLYNTWSDVETRPVVDLDMRSSFPPKIDKVPYYENPVLARKQYAQENWDDLYKKQKARRAPRKVEIAEYMKQYAAENRDAIRVRTTAWHSNRKEYDKVYFHEYHVKHKDEQNARSRQRHASMVAAGFRYRKNPETGKYGYVFVGIPQSKVA